MNAALENNLKWNVWLQESDQMGVVAEYLATEIRQDKNAVSHQHPSLVSRVLHFARRVLFVFDNDSAATIALGYANWLG
jgi:phosphoketolase